MPKLPHFLTLPILTGALALAAWGQGATHPGMSMYAEPSYDGVEREVLNSKTNTYQSQRGYLSFDASEQVKFINRNGNQFKIPYKAIKALEFSFYSPVEIRRSKGPYMNAKLGGKRYLTIIWDNASGPQSTVLGLDPDQYQQVLGSFRSKTDIAIKRPGGHEKQW